MERADNAAWSQTAPAYGSSMIGSSRKHQHSLEVDLSLSSRVGSEIAVRQLVAINSWLREALHQQTQVCAGLRLLVENAGQSMPAAARVPRGRPSKPIMLAATTPAARSATSRENAEIRAATLTVRQREIMDLVLVGHPNKNIAADLQLSQRTVENHRAAIMKKMGASTIVDLVRVGLSIGS